MASVGSAVLTFRHRRAKEESPRAWWSRASCANLTKCSCRKRRGLTTVAMGTDSPHQLLRLLQVEQSARQLEQRQAGGGALQHTPPHTAACLCTQQALPVPVRAPGSTLQLSHGCKGHKRAQSPWRWLGLAELAPAAKLEREKWSRAPARTSAGVWPLSITSCARTATRLAWLLSWQHSSLCSREVAIA